MKYLLLTLIVFLTGCMSPTDIAVQKQYDQDRLDSAVARQDQCMSREIFMGCLDKAPAGPQAVKYNDWDEMVQECRVTANQLSKRAPKYVTPECREM